MAVAAYKRREPEKTLLYQVVQEHLNTFLERLAESGEGLPGYVESALEAFLDCGILQNGSTSLTAGGFARVRCGDCGHNRLVAFS